MKSDNGTRTLVSLNPGRDVQRVGTANFLGEDVEKIHDPVWAVIGNLGDSQCYLGVPAKVRPSRRRCHRRIADDGLAVRLIAPAFTLGVSDGQLNGTPQMRFSLIGRELVNDVRRCPPRRQRRRRADRGGGVRQAAGRDARRDPGEQHARGDAVGRLDPARDRPRDRRADRHRVRLPDGRINPTEVRDPVRAARLPGAGQLRRHVHLQHDADLHRRARDGAAADGRRRRRTTRAACASSPTSWSTACSR